MSSRYPTIRGVSYGRVSTFDQAYNTDGSLKDDASPKIQKLRCEHYVESLNHRGDRQGNYVLVEHISDDGFSGKNVDRPGYKKLWSLIATERIKFVVANELSRLSRNTYDFLAFLSHCEKHGVDVFIIGLNLDTTSPIGKTMVTILVALAQFEREMTSKRVKDNTHTRLVKDGRINGATEILGLDFDPSRKGHFIINKEEVDVLNNIFHIYLNSSCRAEAFRTMKQMGITSKHGKELTKQKFNMLFWAAKYRYRGVWPLKDKDGNISLVKLPHGPVLNEVLLDKVEARLVAQLEKKRRNGKNHVYLLTTLLEFEDGSSFYGHPAKQKQYRYYHNKKNDVRIRCDEIDELILKRLNDYLSKEEAFVSLVKKAMNQRNRALPEIKSKILEVEQELKRIEKEESAIKMQLLITDQDNRKSVADWLESQISSISNNKNVALQQLESLRIAQVQLSESIQLDKLKDSFKVFLGQFKKLPNQNKRGLLERIFQKIVIKTCGAIELHIFEVVFKGHLGKNITTSSTYGLSGGTNRT